MVNESNKIIFKLTVSNMCIYDQRRQGICVNTKKQQLTFVDKK